ncbi:nickel-responsive transcriptional regulator NikR [Rhodobacteraceae bacterium 2376]|uniref:Putative nickel-responsive regulator n=1 Tax=Rhabdonatronobacter sediminivivens TaxID=2743469 RepID=A0A7Z0KX37_9RHOB|nr:nickel-responsive transcriptional regulator NikR [Rhabdonatronobacter sediminivivens]NYS24547.1 nickel-responsive transcriptional regulator NikR [Rhabdonatronobacter sediminivivens]
MQRVTVTLPETLCAALDRFVQDRRYDTRSEAMRDLLRTALRARPEEPPTAEAMGVLSYVYDHHTRDLSSRLMHHHHAHHALSITTSHVHLDHDSCLETAILRGPVEALRAYADGVLGQRGVMHGNLFLIPVETCQASHDHGHGAAPHAHLRVKDHF